MAYISVTETAQELGLSTGRVRRLIATNALHATQVGKAYLLDDAEVYYFSTTFRHNNVRAFSQKIALAAAMLADGHKATFITDSERSRLKKRLNDSTADAGVWVARLKNLADTSNCQKLTVHENKLANLLNDTLVFRSGSFATNLASDNIHSFSGTIWTKNMTDYKILRKKYALLTNDEGNIIYKTIMSNHALGNGDGNAYRLIVAVDLLTEPDSRSHYAGQKLIEQIITDKLWNKKK